ncbi:hypothetical protein [Lelliottia amnigena]|uniref:hypothetical protein n=1 Tax=Lelliottia amnigena TaxID=61646 RepID=UPI001EF8ABD9|nr:hypothetical protein [Lelliottia amnigena]MCG7781204.1 hypothetical protein [Lelliottia amnigena]
MKCISFIMFMMISGCTSHQQVSFHSLKAKVESHDSIWSSGESIKYLSLKPDDSTILKDGTTVDVSVGFLMSGLNSKNENISLEVLSKHSSPKIFKFDHSGSSATYSLSGEFEWKVPVKGRNEAIQVNIYRILEDKNGKVKDKILLRGMFRDYDVICNQNEFFLTLMVKKFFSICKVKTYSN